MPTTNGTLPDEEIADLVRQGKLIKQGFDPNNLKQACYELRASDIFYETSSQEEDKKRVVNADGYVLRPHTYVTVIVQETVALPNNIIGRVIAKGQLFSVGVVPVCTYADPGFEGRLGITLCNISHRHLMIRPGQSVAKIEFSKLQKGVAHPYNGQHGFETEIWPIPTQVFAKPADLATHGIRPNALNEIDASYGPVVANLERRLRYYEKTVWWQMAIMLLTFLAIIANVGKENWVASILVGIVTNLLTTVGINCFEQRKIKGFKSS